jgi:hypothetical protein
LLQLGAGVGQLMLQLGFMLLALFVQRMTQGDDSFLQLRLFVGGVVRGILQGASVGQLHLFGLLALGGNGGLQQPDFAQQLDQLLLQGRVVIAPG